MVRCDGINDRFRFMIPLSQFYAQLYMSTFAFTVYCLAYIMKKAGSLGQIHISSYFSSKNPCKVGYVNGMLKDVLSIAGAIAQLTQSVNQFRMNTADTAFQYRCLTGFDDGSIHFPFCLGHYFFNTGRMDSSILDQCFQGYAGNFPAYRIKAGQNNRFRCVINNEVNPGKCFQSTNIAPFAANNAPLHFFIRQRNNRNRSFRNGIRRITLDGGCQNLSGNLVRIRLNIRFRFPDSDGLFMGQIRIHLIHNHGAGFTLRHLRYFFQTGSLLFIYGIHFRLSGFQLLCFL